MLIYFYTGIDFYVSVNVFEFIKRKLNWYSFWIFSFCFKNGFISAGGRDCV